MDFLRTSKSSINGCLIVYLISKANLNTATMGLSRNMLLAVQMNSKFYVLRHRVLTPYCCLYIKIFFGGFMTSRVNFS